jgi:Secretion system C-terminal sorting domain
LFPNPNDGHFTIRIKSQKSSLKNIMVHDLSGRLVYNFSLGNLNLESGFLKQINLNLTKGTYVLSAKTKNDILKTKFVIAK